MTRVPESDPRPRKNSIGRGRRKSVTDSIDQLLEEIDEIDEVYTNIENRYDITKDISD